MNLKAHWEIKSYTVTFDTGEGATPVSPATVNHGQKVTEPAAPTRDGYTFDGWLLNEVPYNFDDEVTGDLTLNAKWVEDEVEGFNLHIDFSGLTSKGVEFTSTTFLTALKSSEQKPVQTDPSKIVSVASVTKAYDGNGTGGAFSSTAGLVKLGTGSLTGSFKFTISDYVNTVKVLAAGWESGEGTILVNGGSSQSVPTSKTWLTFPLDVATDTITIGTAAKRAFIFEIELIGGPVIPDPELDEIVVSSASGVASVEEKQTLQLSAVVYDVDGAVVENANVTWSSLNEEIATISNAGLVTAVAPGNVMIKVEAVRGTSLIDVQYALEVTARPAGVPDKVVIVGHEGEEPTLTIPLANATVNLQAKVLNQYNEEITGVDLVWESRDTAVATVSNGTVTLLEGGTSMIKVYVDGDSAISAELELIVNASAAVLKTILITPSDFSNLGSANYDGGQERTATINGIEFGTKAITNGTGVNAGKFQTQAKNGVFYNITSLGKIQELILVTSGNATTLYVGNSRLLTNEAAKYAPSGNALGNAQSAATSTWNITTGDFSHFALKRGNSAAYWASITIKYYA